MYDHVHTLYANGAHLYVQVYQLLVALIAAGSSKIFVLVEPDVASRLHAMLGCPRSVTFLDRPPRRSRQGDLALLTRDEGYESIVAIWDVAYGAKLASREAVAKYERTVRGSLWGVPIKWHCFYPIEG